MQIEISPEIDQSEYFDDSENAEDYDPILDSFMCMNCGCMTAHILENLLICDGCGKIAYVGC